LTSFSVLVYITYSYESPLLTPVVWFAFVNRFLGYSQVVSTINYNTPKITVATTHKQRSRDRAVGISTGYGLDDRGVGVRTLVKSKIFSSPRHPDQFWGPPNILSKRYGDLSTGAKRPGCEADYSHPANAEVKKM
jgi:hypothetical protein